MREQQHTDDPLSSSARTAQPLSPEADPFVQDETLGDGSKGRRNDLECRSRELAKQEVNLKAGADQFFLLEPDSQAVCSPVTSLMNSESYCIFCHQQTESFTNSFEPFAKDDCQE